MEEGSFVSSEVERGSEREEVDCVDEESSDSEEILLNRDSNALLEFYFTESSMRVAPTTVYQEPSWAATPSSCFQLQTREEGVCNEPCLLTGKSFFLIGRRPTCDVVIDDKSCSKRHAVIQFGSGEGGDELFVSDLRSKAGTRLNGLLLEPLQYYPILQGDELLFGDHLNRFTLLQQEPTLPQPEELGKGSILEPSFSPTLLFLEPEEIKETKEESSESGYGPSFNEEIKETKEEEPAWFQQISRMWEGLTFFMKREGPLTREDVQQIEILFAQLFQQREALRVLTQDDDEVVSVKAFWLFELFQADVLEERVAQFYAEEFKNEDSNEAPDRLQNASITSFESSAELSHLLLETPHQQGTHVPKNWLEGGDGFTILPVSASTYQPQRLLPDRNSPLGRSGPLGVKFGTWEAQQSRGIQYIEFSLKAIGQATLGTLSIVLYDKRLVLSLLPVDLSCDPSFALFRHPFRKESETHYYVSMVVVSGAQRNS